MDDEMLPFIPPTLRSIALSRTRCTDEAVLHWRALLPATSFNYRPHHRDAATRAQRKQAKQAARREAELLRDVPPDIGDDDERDRIDENVE